MPEIRESRIKWYLPTYTILIWNDIMRIKRLVVQDPFKAYDELKFLIPLLPQDVKDDVIPLFTKFEKRLKHLKELLDNRLDYISSDREFKYEAKKRMKYFIFKVLDVVCDKLEKKKLMYQYDLLMVGGEVEEDGES
jgi:hypothetical protein